MIVFLKIGKFCQHSASTMALLIVLLSAACGLSPPRFGSRAWERRGVYAGRSDMPRVADVASAVGAPAPWQVCASSTLCLEGCL